MEHRFLSNQWLRGLLLAIDVAGCAIAYSIGYTVRLQEFDAGQIFSGMVLLFSLINLFCLYLLDLYQLDPQTPFWKKPLQTLGAIGVAGCVIVLIAYLGGNVEFSGLTGRGVLIGSQVVFGLWAAGWRFHLSRRIRRIGRRSRWLVLGTEEYLRPFLKELASSKLAGHFVFLTPDGTDPGIEQARTNPGLNLHLQGKWTELERLSNDTWSSIVVCGGTNLSEEMVNVLMGMRLRGVRVVDLTDFYEQTWSKVPVFYLQRSWFAMAQGFQLLHNPVGLKLKRVFDILGSATLFLLTLPIVAMAMIAIKLESRGPVFFTQIRVGENGVPFTVFKLRSMRTDAESTGAAWASSRDPRVTGVGRFIRATRIDELPQLLNVLRGEMSFIGPRPERPEFMKQLEREIPFYNLRHILKPGITGWAQVMYPYGASVEDARQKLQYELFYIKNYSLLLDAAIVLKTVRVVLFGQGQ